MKRVKGGLFAPTSTTAVPLGGDAASEAAPPQDADLDEIEHGNYVDIIGSGDSDEDHRVAADQTGADRHVRRKVGTCAPAIGGCCFFQGC